MEIVHVPVCVESVCFTVRRMKIESSDRDSPPPHQPRLHLLSACVSGATSSEEEANVGPEAVRTFLVGRVFTLAPRRRRLLACTRPEITTYHVEA